MYAIYAYIGVVLGVNVGIYGSPMECLGILYYIAVRLPEKSTAGCSLRWLHPKKPRLRPAFGSQAGEASQAHRRRAGRREGGVIEDGPRLEDAEQQQP